MAYNRLTPAQEHQIRNMRNDNKSVPEVQEFFKKNYSITLPAWKVAYVEGKSERIDTGVASDQKPARRAAQRKYAAKKKQDQDSAECALTPICRFIDICNPGICKFKIG